MPCFIFIKVKLKRSQIKHIISEVLRREFWHPKAFEGTQLNEATLPPGFKPADFEPADVEGDLEEDISQFGARYKEKPPEEIKDLHDRKVAYNSLERLVDTTLLVKKYSKLDVENADPKKLKSMVSQMKNQARWLGLEDLMDRFITQKDEKSFHDLMNKISSDKAEMESFIEQKYGISKKGISGYQKNIALNPNKLTHTSTVRVQGDLKASIPIEKFRDIITTPPKALLNQNEKIEKSGGGKYLFYNVTLPAYQGLVYDEASQKFYTLTTCPGAHECTEFCYAAKGGYVQYEGSVLKSVQTLNYLINHYDKFKKRIIEDIEKATKNRAEKPVVIRWHDSGDFFSPKYLALAFDVARATPTVTHYAYTKALKVVGSQKAPDNFVFNFSVGGKHDRKFDTITTKHSKVIPLELWKPYVTATRGKTAYKSEEHLQQLKQAVADEYGIPVESVVTYDEMQKIPYDPSNTSEYNKYNVMVWNGNGDDSAFRRDVLGTYLFIH